MCWWSLVGGQWSVACLGKNRPPATDHRPLTTGHCLIHVRPEQLQALRVESRQIVDPVQIARYVPDQQPPARQGARPLVEPRLEGASPLSRCDAPGADL